MEYQRILSFGKELARYEDLNLAHHFGALQDGMLRVREAFGRPVSKKKEITENQSDDADFKKRWRKTVSSTGFVTFKSLAVKQEALQCQLSNMPFAFDTFPAYEPRDILWENITCSLLMTRIRKSIANGLWIVGICFWAIPVAATQAVSNLEALREKLPWLYIPAKDSLAYSLLTGYLPVIAYLLLMYYLPIAIDISAQRFIRFKSRSDVDSYVFKWHFGFQIANLWLVVIGNSLMTQVSNFVETPSETVEVITAAVPEASQFFLNIIIADIFAGLPLELSMLTRVFETGIITRTTKDKYRSQRTLDARFEPLHLEWGTIYPPLIFTFLVSAVYSAIAPIVQPFCALFYGLAYIVYKHQTLHVYGQMAEGGAAYFPTLSNFLISCLFTAEFVLSFYMGIKGGKTQASFAFLTVIATFVFHRYIHLNFSGNSQTLALETAREADMIAGKNTDEEVAFLASLSAKDIDMTSFKSKSTFIGMNDDLEYTQPALRRSKWETAPMPYRNIKTNQQRLSIEVGILHRQLEDVKEESEFEIASF